MGLMATAPIIELPPHTFHTVLLDVMSLCSDDEKDVGEMLVDTVTNNTYRRVVGRYQHNSHYISDLVRIKGDMATPDGRIV